jgi:hypothetical protein
MFLFNIKKWSAEAKVKFSLFLALILTILILFFSFYIDLFVNKILGNEKETQTKSNQIDSIKDFFKANIKI